MQLSINKNKLISKFTFIILALIIFISHQLIFLSYLNIGSFHYDWINILSRLTVGKIWFLNNGLSIPWFSPHICCGAPYFSNPQSEYYSLIQFLFLFFKPLTTIKITFILYSFLAFLGSLLLLRKIFKLSYNSSLIGSTIFLFNNYFAFHYLSGHHAWALFALIPMFFFIAAYSLNKSTKKDQIFYIFLSALIFALMIHSGGSRIILEILISIFLITLIHILYIKNLKIINVISLSVLIGLLISSSKIYAAHSLVENLSRDVEPIYFNSITGFFYFFIQSFFLFPNNNLNTDIATVKGHLDIIELSFNVSIVPIIIFIVYLLKFNSLKNQSTTAANKLSHFFWVIFLLSTLSLIFINFQNTFLGKLVSYIPFLTTDWVTIRLLAPFILVITIYSAIFFEKISFKRSQIITLALITILIGQNLFFDRSQLYKIYIHNYFGGLFEQNINKKNIKNYKIDKIFSILDKNLGYIGPNPHYFFLDNKSMQFCYFSLFGYNLEALKPIVKNLVFTDRKDEYLLRNNAKLTETSKGKKVYFFEGDPFLKNNNNLNFINPSCYMNPDGNNCEKDYFFKIKDKPKLEKFLNYKPFEFKQLKVQILFNYLSFIFFIICLGFTIFFLGSKIKKPLLKK
jgi:hypothetical protein